MSIRKHIVLVDEHGGTLAGMAPRLKELGFQIVLISDPNMVLDTVRNVRKLALVVMNGSMVKDLANSLVGALKGMHPELPVLYCGDTDAPVEFSGPKPDFIFVGPFPAEKINEHAIALLRQSLYPQAIVDGLRKITTDMLTSFGDFSVSEEPFLKASRTLLLPLNAVIPVTGSDHLAGHLLVSGKEDVLRSAYAALFGNDPASVEVLEDMVGEIANMLAGGIKTFIEKKGSSMVIGVPTFIRGQQVSFRRGILTPSLTLGATFNGKKQSGSTGEDLFVELYFERIDPAIFDVVEEAELLAGDEMTFL